MSIIFVVPVCVKYGECRVSPKAKGPKTTPKRNGAQRDCSRGPCSEAFDYLQKFDTKKAPKIAGALDCEAVPNLNGTISVWKYYTIQIEIAIKICIKRLKHRRF